MCLAKPNKLERMMNYTDGFLTIRSHDPLVLWCWEIMSQTKILISLLPQHLWQPNLAGWWCLTLTGFYL